MYSAVHYLSADGVGGVGGGCPATKSVLHMEERGGGGVSLPTKSVLHMEKGRGEGLPSH